MDRFVLSVSELNRYVRSVLESDRNLSSLYVAGEISNFTDHYRSGHLYFTLGDKDSTIKCVMFSSSASRLRFRPENGVSVICRGRASVYERDGIYQFYCEDMQPDGAGALALGFQQLKEKLEKEGLFAAERKRPLPLYPKKIGVITSSTGAALRDIVNVTGRRFSLAELLIQPALVQGAEAPASLIRALDAVYKTDVDVIIIGRGGGSAEDLSAFNDEALARKIAESPVPVISAVGHETDFSICDFVADMRAPTPSAAAELAVPDKGELSDCIAALKQRMVLAASVDLAQKLQRLQELRSCEGLKYPQRYFELKMQQADTLLSRVRAGYDDIVKSNAAAFEVLVSKLDALSPLNVIRRGYARISSRQGTVTSAASVSVGDRLRITLADGNVDCTVDKTEVLGNE